MGQEAFYEDEGKGCSAVTCITALLRRDTRSTRSVGVQLVMAPAVWQTSSCYCFTKIIHIYVWHLAVTKIIRYDQPREHGAACQRVPPV